MPDNSEFCVAVDWGLPRFEAGFWIARASNWPIIQGAYGIRQIGEKPFADILADARHSLGEKRYHCR